MCDVDKKDWSITTLISSFDKQYYSPVESKLVSKERKMVVGRGNEFHGDQRPSFLAFFVKHLPLMIVVEAKL